MGSISLNSLLQLLSMARGTGAWVRTGLRVLLFLDSGSSGIDEYINFGVSNEIGWLLLCIGCGCPWQVGD